MPARLQLFCGTDSRASLTAIHAWQRVFDEKYSGATRYTLDADELSATELLTRLSVILTGQTLFDEPTLVVVKRLAQTGNIKTGSTIKSVAAIVEERWAQATGVTLAFWEAQDVPTSYPILELLSSWESQGIAKVNRHNLPGSRDIVRAANRILAKYECALDGGGSEWLRRTYDELEQSVRLERRLKAGEPLLEDERGWWLRGVLTSAALRATNGMVGVAELEPAHVSIGGAINPFDIAQALTDTHWERALSLLREFEYGASDAAFFGLWAILGWRFDRPGGRMPNTIRQYAKVLLGEIELISKNYTLSLAQLNELFVRRLALAHREGEFKRLLSPRTLWLARLPRS